MKCIRFPKKLYIKEVFKMALKEGRDSHDLIITGSRA